MDVGQAALPYVVGAVLALAALGLAFVVGRRSRETRVDTRALTGVAQAFLRRASRGQAKRQIATLDASQAAKLLRSTATVRVTQKAKPNPGMSPDGREANIQEIVAELLIKITVARQKLLGTIERRNGSKALAIVHNRDWQLEPRKSHTYFDLETADEFLSVLRAMPPEQNLDIILHTPGGEAHAGIQIAEALKAHKGFKTAYIPFHAYSMGTVIALVADKIVMGDSAVLGPIDPQIGEFPAVDFGRLVREKPAAETGEIFLLLSYLSERAVKESRTFCDLINPAHKRDGTCALTERLSSGELSHAHPIGADAARALGINVSTDMPPEVYEFVELCRDIDKEPAVRHVESP